MTASGELSSRTPVAADEPGLPRRVFEEDFAEDGDFACDDGAFGRARAALDGDDADDAAGRAAGTCFVDKDADAAGSARASAWMARQSAANAARDEPDVDGGPYRTRSIASSRPASARAASPQRARRRAASAPAEAVGGTSMPWAASGFRLVARR